MKINNKYFNCLIKATNNKRFVARPYGDKIGDFLEILSYEKIHSYIQENLNRLIRIDPYVIRIDLIIDSNATRPEDFDL